MTNHGKRRLPRNRIPDSVLPLPAPEKRRTGGCFHAGTGQPVIQGQ